MAAQELQVALIAGPMYDALYQTLPEFTRQTGIPVVIGFHGTHPELNAHLSGVSDVQYHLVSTHTKYAPSQQHRLAPLRGEDVTDFYPALIQMATIGGDLYG